MSRKRKFYSPREAHASVPYDESERRFKSFEKNF
jgi:hypothetical protein